MVGDREGTIEVFRTNIIHVSDIRGPAASISAFNISGNDITIGDSKNFVLSTGTGTQIATSTSQKLGFWNVTPIVQPSGTGETTGFTAGSGTAVLDDSTFTGNSGSKAYRVNDIVKALKAAGIMAAS